MSGVPSSVLIPFVGVEFDPSRAQSGSGEMPFSGLLIGQMLSTGSGTKEVLTQVFSDDEVADLAGVGSMAHNMARRWFKMNKITDCYLIMLEDDSSATEGEVTVTITGTAIENGEYPLYVNGTRVAVAVSVDDTASDVADAFIDKWAEFDYLPYAPLGDAGYVIDTTSYPVADQDGLTEKVTIDGGSEQTVTFSGEHIAAAAIAASMEAQLTGCTVIVSGGQVLITSDTRGSSSSVAIGTGTCALSWDTPVAGLSANQSGVLTLNPRNKGLAAGDVDIRDNDEPTEKTPAGLSVTISAVTPGATDPSVQSALDVINDQWCNVIVSPYDDATNLGYMEDYLEEVYDPMVQKDAVAFHSKRGTVSTLTTFAEASGRNSHSVCMLDGQYRKMSTYELSALNAGAIAKDAQEDPAVPLHRITLLGARPNSIDQRRLWSERNTLMKSGISTLTDDNGLQTESIVTMYLKNSAGAADTAYRYVVTKMILMRARWKFVNRILSRYPRAKLMDDATRVKAGQQIMTPDIGAAEAIAWFREMEDDGQFEGLDQFKDEMVCQRSESNPNRLEWLLPPDLVNQFIVGSSVLQFLQ